MNFEAPTLWDNYALEDGLRALSDLSFEKAHKLLNEAGNTGINQETTTKAIAACHFWATKLQDVHKEKESYNAAESLLEDYRNYSFIPALIQFKKGLLSFITGLLEKETQMSEDIMEVIFDLLLEENLPERAKSFIQKYGDAHQASQKSLYLLAQAEWRTGEKTSANKNYVKALLYYPKKDAVARIENDRLKTLAQKHHPALAPSFAWIEGILPFISSDTEIQVFDENHQKALDSYHYLKQSDKALKNNEDPIPYRKQLKKENPELFADYMHLLQQRSP